jgi:hypothetical protein
VQKKLVDYTESAFLELVARKLATTTDPIDNSTTRIEALRRQIETQLKPVLRTADYEGFALDRVIELLGQVVTACRRS